MKLLYPWLLSALLDAAVFVAVRMPAPGVLIGLDYAREQLEEVAGRKG